MKKILIIQTAYIGDVVLATSFIEIVSQHFKGAQIDFLLRKGNEVLLKDNKKITNLFIWDKNKKYKSMFSLLKIIRKEEYDFCFNIQRFFNSGLFAILSKSKRTVMFNKNPLSFFASKRIKHHIPYKKNNSYFHEVQRNAELLSAISDYEVPKDPKEISLELHLKETTYKNVEFLSKQEYIVLAPSSVWFTKQFSKDQWIDLKNNLDHFQLYFIGAPSDKAFIDEIIEDSKNCINLSGKLSLIESAALMKNAKRVIVNDSAPLHLASSVNAKITAIFCSTVPAFGYGPVSDDSVIIEIKEELNCRPCGLHGKNSCPKEHFKCSKLIKIQDILNSI